MAEYSANAIQTVNSGESIVFPITVLANQNGNVMHRAETGAFQVNGGPRRICRCCRCRQDNTKEVLTSFGGNIAIPTGGTVGDISVAFAIDGVTVPYTTMTVTPAAVDEYFNVSCTTNLPIFRGCCQTVTVRNTSDQAILVQNANIIFSNTNSNGGAL